MFQNMPQAIRVQMERLEAIDGRDRLDGTPRSLRLRQIPPETGRFLALLAAMTPAGRLVEVGTSGGYSTLWLSLACLGSGRRITTFEILAEKAEFARQTFRAAGIEELVEVIEGDALQYLPHLGEVAFCFVDTEKDIYAACYEAVIPNLVSGGILAADNALSHQGELQPVIDRALNDARVDALVVPVGKGVLICRKA